MVLSKAVALAAPALLYPVWSPWIRAGLRNLELYAKQYKCVGLWRAQVRAAAGAGAGREGTGTWVQVGDRQPAWTGSGVGWGLDGRGLTGRKDSFSVGNECRVRHVAAGG